MPNKFGVNRRLIVSLVLLSLILVGFKGESFAAHTNYSIDMTLIASKMFENKTDSIIEKLVESKNRGSVTRLDAHSLNILEKIVMAEAGGEPYEGQVAVANVVINRVRSKNYPNSVEGVVFQKGQFTPAVRGTIWNFSPSSSVKKAVSEALNGRKVVGDGVCFFLNPKIATDMTIPRTKTKVATIGNHAFYK